MTGTAGSECSSVNYKENTLNHQESCKLISSLVKHDRDRLISSIIRLTESSVKIKYCTFLMVRISIFHIHNDRQVFQWGGSIVLHIREVQG